jgi:hypothetical protein
VNETKKWLTAEWQQKCLDAMRETLDVHADLKREMVEFLLREGLWDASKLGWEAAVTKFNACLRPESRECFSNLVLWALVKRFDRLSWFYAMADDLGFEIPRRKATEERRIELLERYTAALEQTNKLLASAADDFRGIDSHDTALRIHRVIREGGAHFSIADDSRREAPTV